MPVYCYVSEDGEEIEEIFPMGKAPDFFDKEAMRPEGGEDKLKIVRYTRSIAAEWRGGPKSGDRGEWPIECYASGVHPDQASELRHFYKKHGVDCEVTKDGDPVYRNHQHRKRCLKVRGICDKASFGT